MAPEKTEQGEISVRPVPGSLNPADMATKCHPSKRLQVLLRLSNFVDSEGSMVGVEEYSDLLKSMAVKEPHRVRSSGKNVNRAMICTILATLLDQCNGHVLDGVREDPWIGRTWCVSYFLVALVVCSVLYRTASCDRALSRVPKATMFICLLSTFAAQCHAAENDTSKDLGDENSGTDWFMITFAFCLFVTCANLAVAAYWVLSALWMSCRRLRGSERVRVYPDAAGSSTDSGAGSSSDAVRKHGNLKPLNQDPHLPSYNDEFPNVHFIYRDRSEDAPWPSVFRTRTGGFYHQLHCKWLRGRQALEIYLPEALDAGLGRCRTCHSPMIQVHLFSKVRA